MHLKGLGHANRHPPREESFQILNLTPANFKPTTVLLYHLAARDQYPF